MVKHKKKCKKCGTNIKYAEKDDCPECRWLTSDPKTDEILVGTKGQLLNWFRVRLLAPHDYIEAHPGVKGEYKNLPISDQIDSILSEGNSLGMVFYLEKVDPKSHPMVESRLIKKYVHVRE